MKFCNFCLILFLIFTSCKQEIQIHSFPNNENLLIYAEKIRLRNAGDSVQISSGNKFIDFSKKDLPLKTAMIIPTSGLAYMDELNLTDKITGISQPDFIFNHKIQSQIKENKIQVIGSFDEIFIEKILINKPDVLISTSSPNLAKFHSQLEKENIKIIYIDEYEELDPLARAEYVKIFGVLFGKEKQADELFNQIQNNYNQIKSIVQKQSKSNPTVFANRIYGDIWYMPGGKSFQARLFKDAGGNYLWDSDDSSSSLNLSFESVFEKANNADIWINAGDFPDKKTLLESYKNYDWLSAFKTGNIYNWNEQITPTGANDYFEKGSARPDLVLKDLAAIFHPELFPGHKLYFYKKLE